MRIQFSPSALDDLRALIEYYNEQGVAQVGTRIANELINATETLADYPQMGRVVPEFDTPSLRELIREPYRIVYRLDSDSDANPDCISIIRIWRNERLLKDVED